MVGLKVRGSKETNGIGPTPFFDLVRARNLPIAI